MPDFTYDPDGHIYKLDGKKLPGVTEVLDSAGLIPSFAKDEVAANRGNAVHLACRYLAEERLDWTTVDPRVLGYVLAYEKFLRDTKFEVWKCEKSLYHREYDYAGTFDNYGKHSKMGVVVLDIKTGALARYHGPQLAAYQMLIMDRGWVLPTHRAILRLSAEGDYKLNSYQDRNDWKVFLSALNLWKWKEAA